ncbi:hypothetical protein [Pseudomonas gingeri]|nr:hypothetical protein [Pseudomonas gingeri]
MNLNGSFLPAMGIVKLLSVKEVTNGQAEYPSPLALGQARSTV